ncbi:MAG: hypothetical protein OEX08_02005 [Candidatus Nomurabacteria bacterium]|nr:hypothetical protein [Candidatus Nomurabacteria bacterium]
MNKSKILYWVLRLAVFGEFLGHGVFALQGKEGWFKYFHALGIMDEQKIITILLIVGIVDIILAISVLIKPIRVLVFWMAIWGLWTALIRWPIGGAPIWDFFERWANWGAPLALLLVMGWPRTMKAWFSSKMK